MSLSHLFFCSKTSNFSCLQQNKKLCRCMFTFGIVIVKLKFKYTVVMLQSTVSYVKQQKRYLNLYIVFFRSLKLITTNGSTEQ